MRRWGRRFLTKSFLLLTGGIVIVLGGTGIYVLFEESFALNRLFAIPVLLFAGDIASRALMMAGFGNGVLTVLEKARITYLLALMFRASSRVGIWKLVLLPKKLLDRL